MEKVIKLSFFYTLLSLLAVTMTVCPGLADIPLKINYQGYLEDSNGDAVTSSLDLTFSLYTVNSGGVAFWSETQTGVPVTNGLFSVQLGDINSFDPADFNTTEIYLGIQVGADTEMTPRQPLTSTAFSFRSKTAEELPFYDSNNDGLIDSDKLNSGIPASFLGAGTVDAGEFEYLDGITANVQSQIDDKQSQIDDKLEEGFDAALIGNKLISNDEFDQLDGISTTQTIQDQLNAKGDMLKSTYDATDSGAIDNDKIDGGLSAGLISGGTVTNGEFDQLAGLSTTQTIQTQLNGKVASVTGDTSKGITHSGTTSVSLGLATDGCSSDDVMTYNGANWACQAPSGGGGGLSPTSLETVQETLEDTNGDPMELTIDEWATITAACPAGKHVLTGYCYNDKRVYPGIIEVISFFAADTAGNPTTVPANMVKFSCSWYSSSSSAHIYTVAVCY